MTLKASRALASTAACIAASSCQPASVNSKMPVALLLDMDQHVARDDVADLLKLDAGADQLLTAHRLRLVQLARCGAGEIELDVIVALVDLVVERVEALNIALRLRAEQEDDAGEHRLHQL